MKECKFFSGLQVGRLHQGMPDFIKECRLPAFVPNTSGPAQLGDSTSAEPDWLLRIAQSSLDRPGSRWRDTPTDPLEQLLGSGEPVADHFAVVVDAENSI
jgi:hypothetical protein